eukprot:snap_masked-scaffold_12-processed-gene-9.11-mRNA-1 protein AED:1.00 eAED:1.00 QI:0/0/0/0/1/1/4/0/86
MEEMLESWARIYVFVTEVHDTHLYWGEVSKSYKCSSQILSRIYSVWHLLILASGISGYGSSFFFNLSVFEEKYVILFPLGKQNNIY